VFFGELALAHRIILGGTRRAVSSGPDIGGKTRRTCGRRSPRARETRASKEESIALRFKCAEQLCERGGVDRLQ
jgi:hypothetical protein